jgi:hypothetical protein
MKRRALALLITLLPVLALSACGPSREVEDGKLLTACTTVLQSLYDPDDTIEVKQKSFLSEKSPEDSSLSTVKIHAYYTHAHGVVEEKDYVCSFEENPGIFGYAPRFYRLDKAGTKYGNFDGTIEGDLNDMIKINQAMVAALH